MYRTDRRIAPNTKSHDRERPRVIPTLVDGLRPLADPPFTSHIPRGMLLAYEVCQGYSVPHVS